jgi:hypothetical protein
LFVRCTVRDRVRVDRAACSLKGADLNNQGKASMKTLVLATALAAVLAGPALAKSNDSAHHLRRDRIHASVMTTDPIGVYVDGTEVGRDPDGAIRMELSNEYYDSRGG